MLSQYLIALLLTLVIEEAVAYLLGFRESKSLFIVALANIVTHPVLNYSLLVLSYLGIATSFIVILFLEMLVVITEWQILVYVFDNPKGRFFITSLLANTTSFLIGIFVFWNNNPTTP